MVSERFVQYVVDALKLEGPMSVVEICTAVQNQRSRGDGSTDYRRRRVYPSFEQISQILKKEQFYKLGTLRRKTIWGLVGIHELVEEE